MNKETNSTVLREARPEREAPVKTAKKYGRTYRRPAAIPYGTTVEDVNGWELEREADGWWPTRPDLGVDEAFPDFSGPYSTTDLAFPVRVILEQSGDRKARGNDRKARRVRGRAKAKARAAKTLRQVHAAEEAREASRLQALEDRKQVLHGEEVGA